MTVWEQKRDKRTFGKAFGLVVHGQMQTGREEEKFERESWSESSMELETRSFPLVNCTGS